MPDDYDQNDDGNDLVSRAHIKGLEDKARRADELAAQVERLTRDNVFNGALAGIEHPGLGYFKDGYKGDLTPEAIRQAAIDAGFGRTTPEESPAPNPASGHPQPTDLAAHQRMAAAAVGAAPPPPFDPHEAIANAKTPEEVMAVIEAHGEKYGVISSRLAQ